MSEMKQAAKALVERRVERFESVHPLEESRSRLAAALERAHIGADQGFIVHWSEHQGRAVLEAEFLPPRGIHALLRAISLGMLVLVVASVYEVAAAPPGAARFLVPLCTVLVILGFPIFTLGFNSQREARESRIRRAIRSALLDADEAFPPRQRWADED